MPFTNIESGHVGVWIDHEKALVVFLNAPVPHTRAIHPTIESKHKSTGGTRSSRPFMHRSVESAKREDHHRRVEIDQFYESVATEIKGCDDVVVIGPAAAKDEFVATLASKGSEAPTVRAVITTQSNMTEPQIVAFIQSSFGQPATRRAMNQAGAPFQE